MSGSFKINVNKVKKQVEMEIRGTFTPEQAKDFHNEYQSKVKSIKANDYVLVVDALDMKLITQDMLDKLQFSFEMYRESNFQLVHFLIKKSTIMKMQLTRVAKNANLNAEIIEVD